MESWQRNTRMMHQIGEFLDLDPDKSDMVADFIALIEALREGLTHIDDGFHIPDSQINVLFLTKLKECAGWSDWATTMLRDSRLSASNPEDRMSFRELADLAMEQERIRQTPGKGRRRGNTTSERDFAFPQKTPIHPDTLTQDDINAFVVQRMAHDDKTDNRSKSVRGHNKRPSQEEINDYVIQQMQREQAGKSHHHGHQELASRNQPHRRPAQCSFCGDKHHQVANCWRRWRVAVEAPQGQFVPKRVEYKFQIPGQPPMYRSGFTLF
ncbi:uncharacterized protein BO97DRAFT_165722 [Aspergillus homomorphus CBS 101889]|uniref:Uncharacterized protein n=1 Tax=Aspergillus homomorphus (strain CBS 101889) TaxID=1450537 RepID=A0A395HNX2_ASPHC|nr:hypothetical protein BO97DRAFT_165722 [Aspergillus homomorphus CBS 101889]RAL09517.1 hypothetical protein BO97DRAFT_165722 [Aspergillus homomorphus CBS 101889]